MGRRVEGPRRVLARLVVVLLVVVPGVRAMRTVDTAAELKTALKRREEVIVVAADLVVSAPLFVHGTNTSLSTNKAPELHAAPRRAARSSRSSSSSTTNGGGGESSSSASSASSSSPRGGGGAATGDAAADAAPSSRALAATSTTTPSPASPPPPHHQLTEPAPGGYALDGESRAQLLVITDEADVLVEDTTLRHGYAGGAGGAVQVLGGSSLELVRCLVESNRGDVGGAIFVAQSSVTLTDTVLWANAAREGGAVYLAVESWLRVADSAFRGNVAAQHGGAVAARTSHLDVELTTFDANRATLGGALFLEADSVATARHVDFADNGLPSADTADEQSTRRLGRKSSSAASSAHKVAAATASMTSSPHASFDGAAAPMDVMAQGGAVFAADSILGVSHGAFRANAADKGGALVALRSQLRTAQCELSENRAKLGAAVYFDQGEWTDVERTAITRNTAEMTGGGVLLGAGSKFERAPTTRVDRNVPDDIYELKSADAGDLGDEDDAAAPPRGPTTTTAGRRRALRGDAGDDAAPR